jgi:uncharacterized protein with FMN-binding domain
MKALKITGVIVAALIIAGTVGFLLMKTTADQKAQALTYDAVDMAKVKDGSYVGEADAGLVYVKLSVTVSNHAIKSIVILDHRNGQGQKAEGITDDMIARNTYDVDTVSGATLSSRAIKSAVSHALSQG